jgi:hypothetical protein
VLAELEAVAQLLDNDWLSLVVVDPPRDHRAFHYERHLEWTGHRESTDAATTPRDEPVAADD